MTVSVDRIHPLVIRQSSIDRSAERFGSPRHLTGRCFPRAESTLSGSPAPQRSGNWTAYLVPEDSAGVRTRI